MDQPSKEARRIPKYLDQTDQIFGRAIDDIAVLIGAPTFLSMAVMNYLSFLPLLARLPIIIGLMGTGIILLINQPSHLSATEWIEAVIHGVFLPTRVNHLASAAGMEREATDYIDSGNWWETSGTTQQLTGIKRIHPTIEDNVGILERDGGTMVGAVEVEGVNMALATSDVWNARVSQFASVLNSMDFDVQIYVTTDAFDIDEHADHYRDRRDDLDIKSRPILGAILDAYIERVIPSIEQGGLNRRRYYVLVEVEEQDIYMNDANSDGGLPIVGGLMSSDDGEEFSEEDTKDLMADEMVQRVDQVVSNMSSIDGCSASRVPSGELARLNHEYWRGEKIESDVQERFERVLPIVVGDDEIDKLREQSDLIEAETDEDEEEMDDLNVAGGGSNLDIDLQD